MSARALGLTMIACLLLISRTAYSAGTVAPTCTDKNQSTIPSSSTSLPYTRFLTKELKLTFHPSLAFELSPQVLRTAPPYSYALVAPASKDPCVNWWHKMGILNEKVLPPIIRQCSILTFDFGQLNLEIAYRQIQNIPTITLRF